MSKQFLRAYTSHHNEVSVYMYMPRVKTEVKLVLTKALRITVCKLTNDTPAKKKNQNSNIFSILEN